MRINQIVSNLDAFISFKGGLDALKDFYLMSGFKGNLTSDENSDDGNSLFLDLQKCGSNFDMDAELSPTELVGIWEGFSLYELPKSWKWMRLDQVGTIVGGGTPDTSNKSYWAGESGTPWITPADMRNQEMFVFGGKRNLTEIGLKESSAKLLPINSVIFSSRAPIGYVGISGVPLATNQGFKSCVPFMPEMAKFIYFYLVFIGADINRRATGTTFKEISGKQFAATPIPVPPLRIQKIIVDKIEQFLQITAETENRIIQRDQFADLARKSAIDAFSTAQTTKEFNIAWNRIQENWEVITGTPEAIGSLRKLILALAATGRLVNSTDRFTNNSTSIELLKVCNVSWGNLSLTKSAYIENGPHLAVSAAGPDGRIGIAEHKAYTPVLSAIGARCGTMFMPEEDFTAIKNTMTLEPNDELLENWYLYYTMMGSDLPRRGSAQPFMSKSDIQNFKIRVPSLNEQKLISKSVEVLLEKCDLLESKLKDFEKVAEQFARSVVSQST